MRGGMTAVGAGSLIIIALMTLYPRLPANALVGTDLVQAVPLVASAAVGHILFGDFRMSLTASLLVGSIPGVWVVRLSAGAPGVPGPPRAGIRAPRFRAPVAQPLHLADRNHHLAGAGDRTRRVDGY
jgi:hypothetical protein